MMIILAEQQLECGSAAGVAGLLTINGGTITKVKAKVRIRVSEGEKADVLPEILERVFKP